MATPKLQWSAAEVKGGVLTVPIEGDRPKGWKDKFAQVVTLLGGGPWGEVVCKSGKVRVTEVADGSQDNVHHFLESAMQEANAAFATGDEPEEPEAGEEDDSSESEAADDPDAQLTESFRNFAG